MLSGPGNDLTQNELIRQIFSPETQAEEALALAARLILKVTNGERCLLFSREIGVSQAVTASHLENHNLALEVNPTVSSIVAQVMKEGTAIISPGGLGNANLEPSTIIEQTNKPYSICVPIMKGQGPTGAIYLQFAAAVESVVKEVDILMTVAAMIATKIDPIDANRQLFEIERIKEDINVALEIQRRLQPISSGIAGWDVATYSEPLFELGGDYFDFIRREKDNRLVIAVGDVAGKGFSAALLMILLRTVTQAQSQAFLHPDEAVAEIHRYFFENTPPNRFATLFYAQLNPQNDLLTYSNAGHNPPFLVRGSGEIIKLEAGGLAVGMLPGAVYEERAISIRQNDILVIYTDGYNESENIANEEFGEERLIELVQKNRERSAADLRDLIEQELKLFTEGQPGTDDRTLVVMKRVS